ncbi:MAG: histidine phosphatase family protein, partial [bacterium]
CLFYKVYIYGYNKGMDTHFYFIRHGDAYPGTEDNIQHPETPLNKRGIEQAKKLRRRLKKIKPDVILVSPYQRALDTMQIVTKGKKVKAEILVDLIEIGADYWPNPDQRSRRDEKEAPSYKEDSEEVKKTFEKIWKTYYGKTVLVFTHGNLIRCLVSCIMNAGWEGFSKLIINLTSLTIIDEDEKGNPIIATVSDFAHLE